MNYEQELFQFLEKNHPVIEEFQIVHNDTPWLSEEKRILYEKPEKQSVIVVAVKGTDKGKIFYREGEEEVLLFEEMLEFVKFLELCKRKKLSQKQGLFARIMSCFKKKETSLRDYKEEQQIEQQKKEAEKETYFENQMKEFQEKKGFVEEKKNVRTLIKNLFSGKKDRQAQGEVYFTDEDFQNMILPEKIVIDGQVTEKNQITAEYIRQVQKCLYRAEYSRIEVTYLGYWERKGKRIPMYEKSLIFLCEDTKAVMYYFNDENLHADVFYDNRDDAGLVDGDWIPEVEFHGQKVSTQHIIYDRKTLNQTLKNMLFHGEINDALDVSGMDKGYFSIRYFKNKNAYMKYKTTRGEF